MKQELKAGVEKTVRVTVDRDRTIGFMGEDCRVYGTPFLVFDIESVCRDLMLEYADPGEDSVGTHISVDHTRPTLLGMWVEICAKVKESDGRGVKFEVSVRDALEPVATCNHSRFVVDVETTAKRLKSKQAKAQALA